MSVNRFKFILPFLILGLECNPGYAQNVQINGHIANSSSSILYLYSFNNLTWEVMDSAMVDGQQFEFFLNLSHRGWYKIGPQLTNSFDIVLGNESLEVLADFGQNPVRVRFPDSRENQALEEYLKFIAGLQPEVISIDSVTRLMATQTITERTKSNQLIREMVNHLEDKKNQFYQTIAAKYPDEFIGKMAGFYKVEPKTTKDNYFRSAHFQDEELASSLYYQGKLFNYLQLHEVGSTIGLLDKINLLVDVSPEASNGREALYITVIKFLSTGAPELASLFARRYQMEYPESSGARRLTDALPEPGPQIGEIAPDIALHDSTGNVTTLSSLRGQYVLLDFWASWCGPCRREAPNVVKAFQQFKTYGFTIYSVSLDSHRDKWLTAVAKDGLDWYHVSDLKGWKSAAAASYKVNSIPATYLIDPEGKIIAKNLRGSALSEMLDKTLKTSPVKPRQHEEGKI